MSRASVDTFHMLEDNGILSERRFQVYKMLWQHESKYDTGLTHNEIADYVNQHYSFPPNYRHNVVARLCELEEMGIVRRVTERECSLSQHSCTTWETVDGLPKKIVKNIAPTKSELISKLCEKLDAVFIHMDRQVNIHPAWKNWLETTKAIVSQCEVHRKRR